MGTALLRVGKDKDSAAFWAVLRNQQAFALDFNNAHQRDLIDFYYKQRDAFESAIDSNAIDPESLHYFSPLHQQTQLFAQGLNYADHREETGSSNNEDEQNLIFTKAPSSLCGAFDDIIKPRHCQLLDYEIELGLVLKQGIDRSMTITESTLPDYIGGLIICNDVSARDEQFGVPMMQWFKGKSYRTFCPAGPILYLMDTDDFSQLYRLQLSLSLNGELKQQANTAQLIHKPAKSLSEISAFANLESGDCLLTGTPGGVQLNANLKTGLAIMLNLKDDRKRRAKFVAAQQKVAPYLTNGDTLQLQIKSADGSINLGTQLNTIKDADH